MRDDLGGQRFEIHGWQCIDCFLFFFDFFLAQLFLLSSTRFLTPIRTWWICQAAPSRVYGPAQLHKLKWIPPQLWGYR